MISSLSKQFIAEFYNNQLWNCANTNPSA